MDVDAGDGVPPAEPVGPSGCACGGSGAAAAPAASGPDGPDGPDPGGRWVGAPAALVLAAEAIGACRVDRLDPDAALSAVLAARAATAAAFAVSAQALARLACVYPQTELDESRYEDAAVVFELMAALGVPQRTAANELARAQQTAALPGLCAALRAGELDVPAARTVLDAVAVLPPGLRAEAVSRLLAAHAALPGGLTRTQLGRLIRRIVAGLDPAGTQDRQADAVRDRRVWHHPGVAAGEEATLGMTGPAERVALCADSIDALARAILDHARSAPRPVTADDTGGAAGGEAAGEARGPAGPVCPPGATLEQARLDALDWLITGRTAQSHPAWPTPHGEHPPGEHPAGDDAPPGGAEPPVGEDEEDLPPWERPTPPAGRGAAEDDDVRSPERPTTPAAPDPGEAAPHGPGEAAPHGGSTGRDAANDAGRQGGEAGAGAGPGDPGPVGRVPADPGVFARPAAPDGPPAGRCGCGRPRVNVTAHVTVSLSTLLALDDAPGELTGHGPIPAQVARQLAATATTWRRLLTDPADAHLVTQTIKTYRPTAAMRAFVLARAHGTCAARGCTARAGLQIDHNHPYPHGPTAVTNHTPLHQPHHQAKTCGAWTHQLDPDTGALTQTSPLGHSYTTTPLPPLGGALTGEPERPGRADRERPDRKPPDREPPDLEPPPGHHPDRDAPWSSSCPHRCPEHPPRLVRHRTTWRRLRHAVLTAGTDPPPDALSRQLAAAFTRHDHHGRP